MSALPRLVIVGGSGRVALLFSNLASPHFRISSLVRSEAHFDAIRTAGAEPKLLSLEDASVDELAADFHGAEYVLFSAGAGGKGGKDRTVKVDQEGAIKVFDALERLPEPKPYLVLVGALDTRDTSQPPPAHYTDKDIEESKKAHAAIGAYYDAKLAADQNLSKRAAFPWTILRPGHLLDTPATGRVTLGKTGMGGVTREDVAAALLALFRLPSSARTKASGRALDLVQGTERDAPVEEAVKAAVEGGESSLE
ncbi:hypothetical protein JCM10449v2_002761 [Rhodotorula kratochvilovae]